MDNLKWERWLRDTTHEETGREIAKAVGVSHTTVQRWIRTGVPPPTVWELTLRFRGDPVAALIVLGRITPEQVADLNFPAALQYVPDDELTKELHRRAVDRRHNNANRTPGIPLLRSGRMERQSFRFTGEQG